MDRRTLRRDKGDRLDLQQQLQAEIAAKTRIQEELTQITSQFTDMERYIAEVPVCYTVGSGFDCGNLMIVNCKFT